MSFKVLDLFEKGGGFMWPLLGLVAIPAITACRLFEARIDKLVHDFNEVVSHLQEWHFADQD